MPTAGPSTAATIGFSNAASVCRNRPPGETSRLSDSAKKSPISLPAVKTPPLPLIKIAPTPSSLLASVRPAVSASYIAPVRAFFFSGRASTSDKTPSFDLFSTWSDIASSSDRAIEILQGGGAARNARRQSRRGGGDLLDKEAR